jgi:hypothetical protein
MSQNSLLVVCGAILMGGLGGYASTLTKETHAVAKTPGQAVVVATPPEPTPVAAPPVTAAPAPAAPAKRANVATATPVKSVRPAQGSPTKKPAKKVVASPKLAADAEEKKVTAAVSGFLAACRSGSAGSIALTMSSSNRKGLMERTKWASRAGMDSYKDFAKNYVKTMSTKLNGDSAEVRGAVKTNVEGTDSQYVKSRKFNRREAYISLKKENGQWKVSGFQEGMQVWNE